MSPRQASKSAFSMIEVMTAMMVISIGLFALIGLQIYLAKASRQSGKRAQAAVQAASVLDQSESRLAADFEEDLNQTRQPLPTAAGFEYQVAVEELDERLKKVDVTVFWEEEGEGRSFHVWTKVLKP